MKEEKEMNQLVKSTQELIFAQRSLKLSTHIYRQRTYKATENSSFLPVPLNVHSEADLTKLFVPIVDYIALKRAERG